MKKTFIIILLLTIGLFMINERVFALNATLTVNKSSVYVDDEVKTNVNMTGVASWNIHIKATGPISCTDILEKDENGNTVKECLFSKTGCVINEVNSNVENNTIVNINKTISATCKATGAGTITFSYDGDNDIADVDENQKTLSGSKIVTVSVRPIHNVTYDGTSYVDRVGTGLKVNFRTNITRPGYTLTSYKYNNREYNLTSELIMPDNDITLVPIWKLIIPTISSSTNYSAKDGYIRGPFLGKKANQVDLKLDSIYTTKIIDVTKKVKTTGLVATGDTLQIYLNTTKVVEYKIVVLGDVGGLKLSDDSINGDGKINSSDLLALRKHLLRITNRQLVNENFLAGDINKDGKINSLDLLLMRKHTLGNKLITY